MYAQPLTMYVRHRVSFMSVHPSTGYLSALPAHLCGVIAADLLLQLRDVVVRVPLDVLSNQNKISKDDNEVRSTRYTTAVAGVEHEHPDTENTMYSSKQASRASCVVHERVCHVHIPERTCFYHTIPPHCTPAKPASKVKLTVGASETQHGQGGRL